MLSVITTFLVLTVKFVHLSCLLLDLRSLISESSDVIDKIQILKEELLRRLAQIDLPNNALDDLIEALGGSENVAEVSPIFSIRFSSPSDKMVGGNWE